MLKLVSSRSYCTVVCLLACYGFMGIALAMPLQWFSISAALAALLLEKVSDKFGSFINQRIVKLFWFNRGNEFSSYECISVLDLIMVLLNVILLI